MSARDSAAVRRLRAWCVVKGLWRGHDVRADVEAVLAELDAAKRERDALREALKFQQAVIALLPVDAWAKAAARAALAPKRKRSGR